MNDKIELTRSEWASLKAYLADHESDIAFDINDYGELESIFAAVFGRYPRKGNPE